jgi:hypothetical protein
MTQRLKGLVSTCDTMGNRLKPFVDRLGDFLNPTVKGTLFESLTGVDMQHVSQGEECWLESDVLKCLGDLIDLTGNLPDPGSRWAPGSHYQGATTRAKAKEFSKFMHRSAIFSPSSVSVRNSRVVIGNGVPGDWYAGEIKQIFTYSPGLPSKLQVYFVIQRFKELSAQEALQDPYRKYPLVAGRLYRPELEDKIEVVPSQEIIAHFAHTPHDKEDFGFPCFHALPLDKVEFLLYRKPTNTNFFQD